MMNGLDMRLHYLNKCIIGNIPGSLVTGTVFTGLQAFQGQPITLYGFGMNFGIIFTFQGMICSLETVSGRRSSIHNGIAGATLGYIGVQKGKIGIPGVDSYFFYRYPRISPPMMGAVVYGSTCWILAAIFGKDV